MFDGDYQLISLTDIEDEFLQGCKAPEKKVEETLANVELGLYGVRSLQER